MKVLVVGSGGREHALLWKAAQSPLVERLYAAPGNAGMEALAERVPWNGEVEVLADWALEAGIDLTLVGPEAPLVEGIADAFWERGLKVFGPTQKAAMIEGSKAFAKGLMERYGIPTARYRTFQDPLLALEHLEEVGVPIVIKDSGLAAGKGVTVAFDLHTAKQAVANILNRTEGGEVVIEEYLEGEEATVLALTDERPSSPSYPPRTTSASWTGTRAP
jgi:phosphoribosylamine--glycine ligase